MSTMLSRFALILLAPVAWCAAAGAAEPAPWHPAPPPADDAIYFVLVDRFANGDPANDGAIDPADPQAFHGGDIAGVIAHLDEIQALGVRTVWLSPVFTMRTDKFFEWGAFHGYWVEDLTTVEPRFGDLAALRQLSDELHARGMRLLLDVVFNHVAMDGALLQQHPDWFHAECDITDWDDPHQLTDCRVHGLPDLAQEHEPVYRHLLEASAHWIQAVRPDGFRIDAVRHMPLSFMARYSADIRAQAGSGFLLLGEDFQGDALSLSHTFAEGGFGALFDFPLHYAMLDVYCHDQPPGRMAAALSADQHYDRPERLVTFLDNHDRPRLLSACGGDLERARQALTFQLTTRGIPALNYGTEAGLEGAEEPHNRGDMVFGAGHPLGAHVTELLALRRAHVSLQQGTTRLLALDDELFVYARLDDAEGALILVNRSAEERHWAVPQGILRGATAADLWTAAPLDPAALVVPPQSTAVVVLSPGEGGDWPDHDAIGAAAAPRREVRVTVRGATPGEGDTWLLVGAGPTLGNWDPAAGVELAADGTGAVRLPEGMVMECKAVLRDADGNVRWPQGINSYLLVDDSPELELVVEWK